MRPYLITTGILFALITVAHVWEIIDRGHLHHTDILIVGAAAGLSAWAWGLLRRAAA